MKMSNESLFIPTTLNPSLALSTSSSLKEETPFRDRHSHRAHAGRKSYGVYLIMSQEIRRVDLTTQLSHGSTRPHKNKEVTEDDDEFSEDGDPLKQVTVELVSRATENKLDPLIGRDSRSQAPHSHSCKKTKKQSCPSWRSGSWKNSNHRGTRSKVQQGQVPSMLKDCEIFALDLGSLLAGTRYRGSLKNA